MPEKEEFISLEKALKELRLKEDELKRLVSEGEIRAFRDADKMKFKREDIEKLKQDTGKTIKFQDESSDTLTDDLLFDEEIEDLDLEDEVGMKTEPISSDETFIDDAPKPKKKASVSKTRVTRTQPEAAAGGARGKTTTIRRTTGRSTQIRVAEEAAVGQIHPAFMGLMILTSLIMFAGLAVWYDIARGEASSIGKSIGEKANGVFGNKK